MHYDRLRRFFLPLLVFVAVGAVWELLALYSGWSPAVFPGPRGIAGTTLSRRNSGQGAIKLEKHPLPPSPPLPLADVEPHRPDGLALQGFSRFWSTVFPAVFANRRPGINSGMRSFPSLRLAPRLRRVDSRQAGFGEPGCGRRRAFALVICTMLIGRKVRSSRK